MIVFHDVASWDRGEYSIKDIQFDKIIISPDNDDASISIMHRMKRIGEFENVFVRFSDLTPDAGLVYSTSEENENKWYGSLSSILSKDDVSGRWIKKTSRLVAQSYDLVFTKNDFSSYFVINEPGYYFMQIFSFDDFDRVVARNDFWIR